MYSYLDKYAYIPEMKLFQMAPRYILYSYSHFQSLAVLFIVDINVRKEPIWKFVKVNPLWRCSRAVRLSWPLSINILTPYKQQRLLLNFFLMLCAYSVLRHVPAVTESIVGHRRNPWSHPWLAGIFRTWKLWPQCW